jgi:hypothetical protein
VGKLGALQVEAKYFLVFSKSIVEFLKLLRSAEIIAESSQENTNTFEYLNKHTTMLLTVPLRTLRFNLESKLPCLK